MKRGLLSHTLLRRAVLEVVIDIYFLAGPSCPIFYGCHFDSISLARRRQVLKARHHPCLLPLKRLRCGQSAAS